MAHRAPHVDIAARIRTAIRTATRTPGDTLSGTAVVVRATSAAQCATISIRIEGPDLADVIGADPEARAWTARAIEISSRVHDLAAEALDWQAGNDRMRFVNVSVGGVDVPDLRDAPPVTCPACGEPGVCELAPCGDPGCDAYDCQRHDDCTPPAEEEPAPVLHTRWTTVQESRPDEAGAWDGWVGVSDATLDDFAAGVVHGRRVDADGHCVPDCQGCATAQPAEEPAPQPGIRVTVEDIAEADEIGREHVAARREVTRHFQRYTPEQRANHAASHRLGPNQRAAVGEHFYTHPACPGVAFPTRGAAARAAVAARADVQPIELPAHLSGGRCLQAVQR